MFSETMSVVTSREVAVIITAAVANLFIAFYLYKWKSKIVISRTSNDGNNCNKKFSRMLELDALNNHRRRMLICKSYLR